MLATVKGYYDGKQKIDARLEKRRKIIDSDLYVIETGRTVQEIDTDIKEMRNDDRF